MRVGPLEPPDSGDGAPALVFEDFEHGKRRFLDLPLGARVRLAPRDPAADSPSLDVTIERLGELVVRWPPP